ncbi:PREDICTED: E3 ubiquitin-protein ligase TTC3-like [Elephantulus edwardii]|uniref:E3 ubiquitin-protein ligase TTC3-like n=1 Tax=Elephantulus edwardii TaxID=28737 RepID=UPI0003F0C352|nr:PREDICTED: E3 ubiquitin-protein ligase TTC3-like [Elephantulus edwardii]
MEDLTIGDYAVLEDCRNMEDWDSATGSVTHHCVRLTQVNSNVVDEHRKDHIQSQKNLEFDISHIWCRKPVSVLKEYCDTIKIYVFWPLLFQRGNGSLIAQLHPFVEAKNSRACELSLEKLQHIELMEEIMDLVKKVVVAASQSQLDGNEFSAQKGSKPFQ